MMGGIDLLHLAGQFGPMGLMVAYLIWRETRTERLARDQVAATKELAVALALLKAAVESLHAPTLRRGGF
jgi:hypothetical protein